MMIKNIFFFTIAFLYLCMGVSLAGTVQLPQAGQTKCYNTAGTEIPCPGTGQARDGIITTGDYKSGTLLLPNSSTNGLDDVFNGDRLDLTKWDPFPFGGATISTGSGLRFSLNGAQNFSTFQVFTLYQFSGDFDAQVDFTLGSGWNTSFPVNDTSPQLHGGGITVYLDEPNWMVITRSRFSNSEGFNFYSKVDLGIVPTSKFTPSTATSGSLRIVATGGTYHFLFNQGSGWVELATAPAWSHPVRLFLSASNVNAHVSFSSTLNNFRINSGSTDYQPYQLPGTFLRRPAFMIGGQFCQATVDRYFGNLTGYNPMSQLFAQGMSLARGCMTTVSDPDLASTPPAQWHTLGWKDSYWSSLQMITQLFKDAMAAGMRINACFFLSEGAAGANGQDAPMAWRNLSVTDTAALVEQYMYDTTTYLINQGIQVDLYDIGNEILFGILNFRAGDRLPSATGIDISRSISYLKTSVWPTEATLLTAAIRGVRRADPKARIVLHIESLLSPGMDTAFAFFQTMQSLGVPYDVAALSLPYVDYTNLSGMTAQEYFHRLNCLANRIASLGKPVYIAENSYPADTDPAFNLPMPDFPYTEAGQASYVNSQLRWASNNQNIIGWTWFYPESFPGIHPSTPSVLAVQGFYRDRQTVRPAAAELNVALPNCAVLTYPYSEAFIPGGGDGVIFVTSGAGCHWTGSSNASWITITSGASGSGNGTVTYSVAANPYNLPRIGTMTIAGETFTVTQEAAVCTYSISPTSRSHGSGAGTGSVDVTTLIGCNWIATSNAAWITITSGSNGTGSGAVNYSVSANPSSISRSGTMTIAGQTFTVNQDGAACTYSILPMSRSHGSGAETGSVDVTTLAGCSWTAASNNSWITITSGGSSSGNGTVTYSVAANAGTSSRTGTLIIAGLTFTLTQDGATPSPITLTAPSNQASFSACSLYSLPSFAWNPTESFKSYEIRFSSSDTFSPIFAKVKTSATGVQISSSTWKKIVLIPGVTGGSVYWKVVGTRAGKTQAESNVFSILIEGAQEVDNPQISPTSKSFLPTLSWENHCNMKFKVWFGNDSQFSKKKFLSFSLKNLSETFTKALTSSQWSSVRKLVGDAAGATIYWYVESWDGLGRYTKTAVMNFVLLD